MANLVNCLIARINILRKKVENNDDEIEVLQRKLKKSEETINELKNKVTMLCSQVETIVTMQNAFENLSMQEATTLIQNTNLLIDALIFDDEVVIPPP
jgi:archaellum component FlaC